ELFGHFDAHALLDVVKDLLVAGFITHQQQAQTAVAQLFQRFIGHVRLGVARQVTPSLPNSFAMASARGRLSVKVSSSKKNSFVCGNAFIAHLISSITCWT